MSEIGASISSLEMMYQWKKDTVWKWIVTMGMIVFGLTVSAGYYLHLKIVEAIMAAHDRQLDALMRLLKETGKMARSVAQ